MKKILSFFLMILIVCCLTECTDSSSPVEKNPPRELNLSEKAIVSSDNNFGLKLFREIIKEENNKNVFISPLSVSMALGMTYNGAAGITREEMQKTLELIGLSDMDINESYKSLIKLLRELDDKVIFQIANSIWYRLGWKFEDDFLNINKTYFGARIDGLNFDDPQAPVIINKWVEDNTNGKIKEIVKPPIDPLTVMFLINAIYFKGNWTYEFDKKLTKDGEFIKPDGSKVSCKMMEQESKFQYFNNEEFQAVDLPYGDGKYSMVVILPLQYQNINSFIDKFDNNRWNELINNFRKENLILFLPKFKMEYEISLNNMLKTLGMESAFSDTSADFSRMFKYRRLFINEVKHKTFVDVNEEGTEAAAVTSVEVGTDSGPLLLYADHPFVFVIRENHSGTILFIGKIVEPLS